MGSADGGLAFTAPWANPPSIAQNVLAAQFLPTAYNTLKAYSILLLLPQGKQHRPNLRRRQQPLRSMSSAAEWRQRQQQRRQRAEVDSGSMDSGGFNEDVDFKEGDDGKKEDFSPPPRKSVIFKVS